MSLRQSLGQGDWVRATSTSGSVIEGQAAHDIKSPTTWNPSALLVLVIADDQDNRQTIQVNVNSWDVATVHRNLL